MQPQKFPWNFPEHSRFLLGSTRPRHSGFSPIQGYGRALRLAGKPRRGHRPCASALLRGASLATFIVVLAVCSGGGGRGGGGNPVAPVPPPAPTGTIEVTTATSGADLDADGYEVTIDGNAVGRIGLTETRVFDRINAGGRQVRLGGVQSNCAVSDNPRAVAVQEGGTSRTSFQIGCSAISPPPTITPLSFVAIAGNWSGIMTETQPCCVFRYLLTYTLDNEAPIGQRIGSYIVSDVELQTEQGWVSASFSAQGILIARSASGSLYEVDETVTMATGWADANGIQLTHDPGPQTLTYKSDNPVHRGYGTTGVLVRAE